MEIFDFKTHLSSFCATQNLHIKRPGIKHFKTPLQQTGAELNNRESTPKRLGKLIEQIFEGYIEQSHEYSILLKNIQIIDNKKTIGELDFILEDSEQKIFHCELAYKFYLWKADEKGNWVGPNLKDALYKKTTKLLEHQFPLIEHPITKKILADQNISTDKIVQMLCLKAQLFLPTNFNQKLTPAEKTCVSGFYCNFQEFQTIYEGALFHIPAKMNWHILPKFNKIWQSMETTLPALKASLERSFSPLVWIKRSEKLYEKCFVIWW